MNQNIKLVLLIQLLIEFLKLIILFQENEIKRINNQLDFMTKVTKLVSYSNDLYLNQLKGKIKV